MAFFFTTTKQLIMKETLEIALTKAYCPVCTKLYDNEIVMNKKLNKYEAAKVKKLHGQPVGFLDNMCDECKEKLKEFKHDGIFLIGIDVKKSNPEEGFKGFYRTGTIAIMKREAFKEKLSPNENLLNFAEKHNFVLMDSKVFDLIRPIQ